MCLKQNSFNVKKWSCFLLVALLLNIATIYVITYTFKPKQHILTISLQNQDASEFSQKKEDSPTKLGLFNKQEKLKEAKEQPKKSAKKKPSNAQSKIVYKANIKNQSALQYPKSALRREIEGKVILNILVDKKGIPVEVKIVTSSGFSILDNAAISSAKAWNFEPINVTETNVDFIWVQVAIDYKIKHENKV